MWRVKSGKEWSLSSNIKLEAKFNANGLAFSCEDVITSLPFMITGTDALLLLRIILEIFQNSQEPSLLSSFLL